MVGDSGGKGVGDGVGDSVGEGVGNGVGDGVGSSVGNPALLLPPVFFSLPPPLFTRNNSR